MAGKRSFKMMVGILMVGLLLLQKGLAFHPCSIEMKLFPASSLSDLTSMKKRAISDNIKMNAAIPMRGVNIGSKIIGSTFRVRKQLSFVTTASRAFILLFVALVSRFKSKVSRAVSTMEGGWSKRGYNGAFWRTVEVWRFTFSFLFKYVSNMSCDAT